MGILDIFRSRKPKVGEKWVHKRDAKNPFRKDHYEILDVKQGYVLYRFCFPTTNNYKAEPRSCSVYIFVRFFTFWETENGN